VNRVPILRFLPVAHQLGELDLKKARIELRFLERAANHLEQLAPSKLRGRHIDGNAQRQLARALPSRALAAGFTQHPGSDLVDQSALLCQRNELHRLYEASLRMAPADQRLCAVNIAGGSVDLGLIEQFELLKPQHLMQLALEAHAFQRHRLHAGAKAFSSARMSAV